MAKFFLGQSKSYQNSIKAVHLQRLAIVCAELKDNYRAGKDQDEAVYNRVVEKVKAAGIKITRLGFTHDKKILRTCYLWLTSDEATRTKIFTGAKSSMKIGLESLIKDGINTWADLKLDEPEAPAMRISNPQRSPAASAPALDFNLSGSPAGQEVLSIFFQLAEKVEILVRENEDIRKQVTILSDENKQLSLRAENDEIFIKLVEDECAAVEGRLQTAKDAMKHAHSVSLQEIATQHPQFPDLFRIAQQMEENKNKRQGQMDKLLGRLPQTFSWSKDSGKICYELHFLNALLEMRQEEQDQVIKHITMLSKDGPEQNSLHTNKCWIRLPYSPPECLVSRGANDLRFVWKKNGDITVYWLFRKGDSRVRYKEQ